MEEIGKAVAYGAATIVNAIATGKGAAFSLNLQTTAQVRLTEEAGVVRGRIIPEAGESTLLMEKAVQRVLKYFGFQDRLGAEVETRSNIPIARGLKSSSTAANALVLATSAALGKTLDDSTALNLAVDAAFEAKTTITGAYDDACASFLGGIILTDNLQRKILRQDSVKDWEVLILLPSRKAYTYSANVNRMKLIAPLVELAFQEALKGNYWKALTLNGVLYSAALGYDPQPTLDALKAGALAAGLSGKGPATVAVTRAGEGDRVAEAWRDHEGEILRTETNRARAHVLR